MNYENIENLNDEQILQLYDDVIFISVCNSQAHLVCTCVDGYTVHYTGWYSCDGAGCPEYNTYSTGRGGGCDIEFCVNHGGAEKVIARPDKTDPCCLAGDTSCWRSNAHAYFWE